MRLLEQPLGLQFLFQPLKGYLEIVTEDGGLRLVITGGAAADLIIDLKQLLALEQAR